MTSQQMRDEIACLGAELDLYERSPPPEFMADAVEKRKHYCGKRIEELTVLLEEVP